MRHTSINGGLSSFHLKDEGARRNCQAVANGEFPTESRQQAVANSSYPGLSTPMAAEPATSEPTMAMSHPEKLDEESQKSAHVQPQNKEAAADSPSEDDDQGLHDNSNVPRLSYPKLFWFFFYNFGLFAWGGPVAQIALLRDKLVTTDKWITLPRFQRVFSVYQILPGPEAAELCMFFGCLSAGRIGGIIAGMAFILPGFLLMLLASYVYTLAGFDNVYFNASFRALQPIVAAMVCAYPRTIDTF